MYDVFMIAWAASRGLLIIQKSRLTIMAKCVATKCYMGCHLGNVAEWPPYHTALGKLFICDVASKLVKKHMVWYACDAWTSRLVAQGCKPCTQYGVETHVILYIYITKKDYIRKCCNCSHGANSNRILKGWSCGSRFCTQGPLPSVAWWPHLPQGTLQTCCMCDVTSLGAKHRRRGHANYDTQPSTLVVKLSFSKRCSLATS